MGREWGGNGEGKERGNEEGREREYGGKREALQDYPSQYMIIS